MSQCPTGLHEYLREVYELSPYNSHLGIKVASCAEGEVVVTMSIEADKHTNLTGVVHGGALASMADTSMGMACATTGSRAWTIDMNISYMKNVSRGVMLTAIGTVIHKGKTTIVAESRILDSSGALLAKARGTFFVAGRFDIGAYSDENRD